MDYDHGAQTVGDLKVAPGMDPEVATQVMVGGRRAGARSPRANSLSAQEVPIARRAVSPDHIQMLVAVLAPLAPLLQHGCYVRFPEQV